MTAETFSCPHCGHELPVTARFCRECGASGNDAWDDTSESGPGDGWSDPDDFDYDDYVRREFGDHSGMMTGYSWKWYHWVAVALLIGFALSIYYSA